MNEEQNKVEELVWFPLRVTYKREMKVKADLDKKGIENFVPMQYKSAVVGGRLIKTLAPIIHNLIFVRCTRSWMAAYKESTTLPIRYYMNKEKHEPIVVPKCQMDNFIAVAGSYDEQLIFLNPSPGDFCHGDRVKILGGPFEGAEGVFVRVKGDRRVVVSVDGVVAVATTFIHPSLLQKIDKVSDNNECYAIPRKT